MTTAVPTTEPLAGRFRLERLLGHGGMADVYRASDALGGPPVAIKVVRSNDPELARRLTREARAVAGFDHPGLVRMLDAGMHDRHAFLVMELVDGQTLAERLRRGPLDTDRCAALGASLADALAYVHRRGVVHRDVKPANVLLGPGSRVRLADFGIAQVLDASMTTVTGTTLGTAAHMAPEQLDNHRVGPAADVWALAAVLLECLTGQRTFEGAPAEVVARRLAGARPTTDSLPAPWRMVLDAMFDADPARRPEASELSELLESPVFSRPWDPRATQAFEPPVGSDPVPRDPTDASPPTVVAGEPTMHGALPAPLMDPLAARRHRRDPRTVALVAAALLAAILAGSLGAWALAGAPASRRHHSPPASPSTTVTSTTASTTTTTVPAPTVASTSAALVNDVQSGESSGALSHDVAQNILNELGQALSAQAQGDTNGEEAALGNMEQTITGADSAGKATAAETQTLLSDVAALASAMGVANTSTTTTTTTAPTNPTGPNGNTTPSGPQGNGPGGFGQ